MSDTRRRVSLTDTNGTTWVADPIPDDIATGDVLDGLAELLSDYPRLKQLNLEIDGFPRYFNPAHIVSVGLLEER